MNRRPRRRPWALVLLSLVLSGLLSLSPVQGVQAEVVTCTREALQKALDSGGLITFTCGPTILFDGTQLTATKDATIDGANQMTLDGQVGSRILEITPGTTVTLTNIVLTRGRNLPDFGGGGAVYVPNGGKLVAINAHFMVNQALDASGPVGGAIRGEAGSVITLLNSSFENNSAYQGGATYAHGTFTVSGATYLSNTAVFNGGAHATSGSVTFGSSVFQGNKTNAAVPGDGGAIHALGSITVTGSTFTNNRSVAAGGAVWAGGSATIAGSSFLSNSAATDGGAVFAPTETINGSTIVSNTTGFRGGGAYANNATIISSTIGGNKSLDGGGVWAITTTISSSMIISNTTSLFGGGVRAVTPTIVSSTIVGNSAAMDGGGVYAGTTMITGSTIVSNTAVRDGGGIYAGTTRTNSSTIVSNTAGANGGGVVANLTAEIDGSTIVSNTAGGDGGGVYAASAMLSGSLFLSNTAAFDGGAIRAISAAVGGSSFVSNTAFAGGGIWASTMTVTDSLFIRNKALSGGGTLALINAKIDGSTFVSNTAGSGGGGVFSTGSITVSTSSFSQNAGLTGGALWAERVTLVNTTLASNRATSAGASVYVGNSPGRSLELTNVTLFHSGASVALAGVNAGTPVTVTETILTSLGAPLCQNLVVKFVGNNISRDPTSCGPGGAQADPLLGSLQDNGGPTLTMAPLPGSPAIGTTSPCLTTFDQRGVFRSSPCDIGAYETGTSPTLTNLTPPSGTVLDPAFTLTIVGTSFIPGTVALWNGSVRPTTVLNSTTLSVSIPASDLLAGGSIPVQARYGNAADGTSNSLPFTMNKRPQTITFDPIADRSIASSPFSPPASASSGLPVNFSAGPPAVCAASGSSISLLGPGSCTVTASQPGDGVYQAATPVNRSFQVIPGGVFIPIVVRGHNGGW